MYTRLYYVCTRLARIRGWLSVCMCGCVCTCVCERTVCRVLAPAKRETEETARSPGHSRLAGVQSGPGVLYVETLIGVTCSETSYRGREPLIFLEGTCWRRARQGTRRGGTPRSFTTYRSQFTVPRPQNRTPPTPSIIPSFCYWRAGLLETSLRIDRISNKFPSWPK